MNESPNSAGIAQLITNGSSSKVTLGLTYPSERSRVGATYITAIGSSRYLDAYVI